MVFIYICFNNAYQRMKVWLFLFDACKGVIPAFAVMTLVLEVAYSVGIVNKNIFNH